MLRRASHTLVLSSTTKLTLKKLTIVEVAVVHVTAHRRVMLAEGITRLSTRTRLRGVSRLELVVVVHVHRVGVHVRALATIARTVGVAARAGDPAAVARIVGRGVTEGGEQVTQVVGIQAAVAGRGLRQGAHRICEATHIKRNNENECTGLENGFSLRRKSASHDRGRLY